MSTTEIFLTSIVCAFALGVIVTALSYEWSYRRINKRLVGYRVDAHTLRAELDLWQHRGTPYIRTGYSVTHPTVPSVVASGRAGLRAVGDQIMYSSDWLNDR